MPHALGLKDVLGFLLAQPGVEALATISSSTAISHQIQWPNSARANALPDLGRTFRFVPVAMLAAQMSRALFASDSGHHQCVSSILRIFECTHFVEFLLG